MWAQGWEPKIPALSHCKGPKDAQVRGKWGFGSRNQLFLSEALFGCVATNMPQAIEEVQKEMIH